MIRKVLAWVLGICPLFIFTNVLPYRTPLLFSHEQRPYIEKTLALLTSEERKNVQDLFEHLFFFDQCSYPLFGTKPISIGRILPTRKAKKGWEAWKKIAPFFHSEKFIIREHVFQGHKFILVANLDEVEKTYNRNRAAFEQAFGHRLTSDLLKACIIEENALFQEVMHNDLIVGILLGYGARNAQIFSEGKEEKLALKPFSQGHPILYYFSPVMPPFFVCDPDSEETLELQHRYKKERKLMIKMSKNEPLFIQMLGLLAENSQAANN